ncbi:MAG: cohesin domain-containing protein, partial [Clostridiales bacterium]|nr:cohesin domain-containing protein [Clostridiales bacterium]
TAAPNWATGSAESFATYQTRAISTIAPQTALTVPFGTAIGEISLPEKVQLSFADSFSTAPLTWTSAYGLDYYPVDWDTSSYNGNAAGTYTILGTVSHTYVGKYTGESYTTTAIVNPDNVKASITVVVEDAVVLIDQPEVEEVRIISNNMIELHWKVYTKYTGNTAAYRYSDGHPDTLTGAGSSLNFHRTQTTDRDNFEIKLDGVVRNQPASSSNSASPYYWHADNYLLHQVRMNQHVTTLRLSTSLTSAQMTALENGTSKITVQIIGDVTNRAGVAADKTKIYEAIWKPYYDKQIVAKTGLTIKGSQYVDIRTVQKAADITDVIMSAMPQEVVERISSQGAFLLFGPGEHSGNIPEQRVVISYDQFNRAEGYGGTNAATSAANVERCNVVVGGVTNNPVDYYPAGYRSGYQHESILAHEFGHKIQSAFNSVYASTHPLRQEFTAAFANVTGRVMWTPYVRDASGGSEYFATMTSVWYNGMSEGNAANCNTRDEFFRYDRKGYDFFSRLFSLDKTILSPDWANCPNTAAPNWATGSAESFATYQTRAISTIAPQTALTVPFGTAIGEISLPEKVQLSFADSFSTAPLAWTSAYGLDYYPVVWDTSSYNSNAAGTYTILGTVSHTYVGKYTGESYTTTAIVNPDNVKASITVVVLSNDCVHGGETYEVTVLEPTCEVVGVKEIYCSICDELLDEVEIPALGHDLILEVEANGIVKYWVCQREGCDYKERIPNYTVYMEPDTTTLAAGESVLVDVIIEGDVNYTLLTAEIAYNNELLQFNSYTYLRGWIAAVSTSTSGTVTVQTMPTMNSVVGESCAGGVKVATLKFTLKEGLSAEETITALSFNSLFVGQAGNINGAVFVPGAPVTLTLAHADEVAKVGEFVVEEYSTQEYLTQEYLGIESAEEVIIIQH